MLNEYIASVFRVYHITLETYQELFLHHLEFLRLGTCFQSKSQLLHIRIGKAEVEISFLVLACKELEHTLVEVVRMVLVCMGVVGD